MGDWERLALDKLKVQFLYEYRDLLYILGIIRDDMSPEEIDKTLDYVIEIVMRLHGSSKELESDKVTTKKD